eukprot:2650095-Rhodomonas_salina.3
MSGNDTLGIAMPLFWRASLCLAGTTAQAGLLGPSGVHDLDRLVCMVCMTCFKSAASSASCSIGPYHHERTEKRGQKDGIERRKEGGKRSAQVSERKCIRVERPGKRTDQDFSRTSQSENATQATWRAADRYLEVREARDG